MTIAVIFISQLVKPLPEIYPKVATKISKLAMEQPGYVDEQSSRDENGFGVSVSFWETVEDAKNWKENAIHKNIQERGKNEWYEWYRVEVAEVQRSYEHSQK